MKKISYISAIILLIFAAPVLISASAATSLSDSLRIGNQTQKLLGGDGGDFIRVYSGSFLDGFAEGETITSLTGDAHVKAQVYMARGRDGFHCVCIDGETAAEPDAGLVGTLDGETIFGIVSDPERILPGDAHVENVWCLDGDGDDDGLYIYFATSAGDYVYYKGAKGAADGGYMLPAGRFTEFAKAAVGGETFDLAPYAVSEPQKPDLLLIAAAVIAAAGIALLGWRAAVPRG